MSSSGVRTKIVISQVGMQDDLEEAVESNETPTGQTIPHPSQFNDQFNRMKLEIIESANARRERENSKPNTSGVRSMNRSVMARESNRQTKPLGEFAA